MTATLASHILDAIRDCMKLHVGFCRWSRDDGVSLWVCSARDNEGQRRLAKHEDFYGVAVALAGCTMIARKKIAWASRDASRRSPGTSE